MRLTSTTRFRAASATAVLLLVAASAHAQQPGAAPAAGAPRQGGGGFAHPDSLAYGDYTGWTKIWDGTTLAGWSGNTDIWKIANGAISATSTCEKPTGTTYLIWQGGQVSDFELKVEFRMEGPGINGGIQYRSAVMANPPRAAAPAGAGGAPGGAPGGAAGGAGGAGGANRVVTPCPSGQPRGQGNAAANAQWNTLGPQMDISGDNGYTGQYYHSGAQPRFIEAARSQVIEANPGRNVLLGSTGDIEGLSGFINLNGWNQVHIIARGHTIIHMVNGHVMAVYIDNDPQRFRPNGVIAVQIEGTGTISYRNIYLKQ
jgi:hypothetical protein